LEWLGSFCDGLHGALAFRSKFCEQPIPPHPLRLLRAEWQRPRRRRAT